MVFDAPASINNLLVGISLVHKAELPASPPLLFRHRKRKAESSFACHSRIGGRMVRRVTAEPEDLASDQQQFQKLADSLYDARPVPNLQKAARRVRFHARTELVVVEKVPAADKLRVWFSNDHLKDIKLASKYLCRQRGDDEFALSVAYQRSCETDSDVEASAEILQKSRDFCDKRGLERWSSHHHVLSRCMTTCHGKTEVFLEQLRQTNAGIRDAERVATAYANAIACSAKFARILAAADHMIAVAANEDDSWMLASMPMMTKRESWASIVSQDDEVARNQSRDSC